MPHLNRIGFTHFRVFEQRTELALAPITILTGTNSSGKSSVLKAFQLLQENIKDLGYLNFAEGEHKLGNFELSLNRNAKDKTITFMLPIEHDSGSEEDKMYANLVYELDETNELNYGKLIRLSVCIEKTKKEIIGVTPWDNLDIDFEYFHLERILKYNLDLLKYYRYANDIFYNKDAPKNLEVLRKKTIDFLTYSKSAKEIVKQIYQSDNDAQFQKLLKVLEIEFPNDFQLYQGCEKEYLTEKSTYLEQIDEMTFEENYRNSYFVLGLPENLIKNYILFSLGDYQLKQRTNEDIETDQQQLDTILPILLSTREELRKKYHFENRQELTLLLFEAYLKNEKNRLQSYRDNLMRGIMHRGYDGRQSDIQRFLSYLFDWKRVFDLENYYLGEDNILIDLYDLLKKDDESILLNYIIFGKNIDSIDRKIGIYHEVELILRNVFNDKSYNNFLKIFNADNFHHLEAVRANTQRLYTFQSQGTSFNRLLLNFIKKKDEKQINWVNKWLNELGIAKELKIEIDKSGIGATINIDGQALADLGYGITQLLPILIKLATITDYEFVADSYNATGAVEFAVDGSFKQSIKTGFDYFENKILYIEEPETNLHPKLQSKLADIFVEACEVMKIQLIIETHSEYLIRKLQYLTAKKTITPDMTVIHYFYDPKEERPAGEPQVKQINIQPDGRLTAHFGTGFYDESARLMMAILTGDSLN